MERTEALAFLGLSESATSKQIKKRIEEKILHYEELSSRGASAFLRKLNLQHLSKVLLIQKELLLTTGTVSAPFIIEEKTELDDELGLRAPCQLGIHDLVAPVTMF